jgi:ubiquinone/menaquinone biosynthesis C-methylase UbiE
MRGNYDAVAGFYDRLSRLVFGDAIHRAQLFLLKAIPAKASVLIVGGGTGWILEEIARVHNTGLRITYVEISERMIQRSGKRNAGNNQLTFIHNSIQEARLEEVYDVVITPFLFDNFSADTLQVVFSKINQHLKNPGIWLYADFQNQENKLFLKVLLKVMYLFFGLLCNLETSNLPDSTILFDEHGYRKVRQRQFYDGFISTVIYQKNRTGR